MKSSCQKFVRQTRRKYVLQNMLTHVHLTGKEIFDLIMTEGKKTCNKRRQGLIYETLCQILIIVKCIQLEYTEIFTGQLQSLKKISTVSDLLDIKVNGGGNNKVDMVLKMMNVFILISMKYKNKFGETDCSKIDNTVKTQSLMEEYKIALMVKDKALITRHRYKNKKNIDKQLHDMIIANNLLFDKNDVIQGLDVFRQQFGEMDVTIDDFIEYINATFLDSPRQQLVLKLHQRMTLLKYKQSLSIGQRMFCISHKPRSGKSITMLLICKYLLEQKYKKILFITAVPSTLKDFMNDLNNYIDFRNISYKNQDEVDSIDKNFQGIVFCSVQYWKMDPSQKKKALLKQSAFDVIIADESHQGSSTEKTKTEILDIDIDDLRQTARLNIFASGTADKTKKYFNIPESAISEWGLLDEARMKQIGLLSLRPEAEKKEHIEWMTARHGPSFTTCIDDTTLNADYSKQPIQVLMKYLIPQSLCNEINEYNVKTGIKRGYDCASMLAQRQIINSDGIVEYDGLELAKDNDGIELLKAFFECIISKNRMRDDTIMKKIEKTQTSRQSRKSTVEHPLLFIMYLPTHTGIASLQKAIIQFLKEHDLWSDYTIEYSNAIEDSGHVKEEYNDFINTIMNKTKTEKKRGCILLLGNKGTVGITYRECDVTISLDDGHNLDNYQQKLARALTDAEGKTIGINVDMNIQRTYVYLMDLLQRYRKYARTSKSNAEILYYLYEQNIFLFDPQEFNNGRLMVKDIMSYYQNEADNIMDAIDDSQLIQQIKCDDDMRDILYGLDFKPSNNHRLANSDLEGEQQDCPKGDKTKVQIDAPGQLISDDAPEGTRMEEAIEERKNYINKTFEVCKYMVPFLSLLYKAHKIFDFSEIMVHEKTKPLVIAFLVYKKIEAKEKYNEIVHIMRVIISNNQEIINNIREIYSIAPSHKLRVLIEKHFVPTIDEKKQHAEVPTPVKTVDEMLNSQSLDFWKTPKSVLEPCCGKGNFILGIFDRFNEGLKEMYPDEIERCRVIMTTCIYYADINLVNVFITTEILKCHVQSYCGLDELDYEFNSYTGNTLEVNIENTFGITGFDMICGNPPYNSSGDTATGNTIWQHFTRKALTQWLQPNGYLLFVHPPGWRKPNTKSGKYSGLNKLMCIDNQMLYLEIHGIKDGQKVFHCGTRYDWYLIHKTKPYKDTIVIDEENIEQNIDLSNMSWLPNSKINIVKKILAVEGEERCPIIYSRSNYGSDNKKHISKIQNDVYKYTVIHTIPLSGIRYVYSSINNKGHFGTSKVIFGDNGLNDVVIDMEGIYGMTENSMAIEVKSSDEANNIKKAILSSKFKDMLKSCIIGNFRIDWRLFNEFKKEFWKDFI